VYLNWKAPGADEKELDTVEVDIFENYNLLPRAPIVREQVYKGSPGWVSDIDARKFGQVVVDLGGGRKQKSDIIDPSVGIELAIEVGSAVEAGQSLFTVHAASVYAANIAIERLAQAIQTSATPIAKREALVELF
jgi:thymidine phosphorylase